jgi:hypothetical protein
MWVARRLTTMWASTMSYWDSFALYLYNYIMFIDNGQSYARFLTAYLADLQVPLVEKHYPNKHSKSMNNFG